MDVSERVGLVPAEEDDAAELAEICRRAFDTDVDVGASGPGGPPGYDSPRAQVRLMGFMDYHKILLDDVVVGGVIVGHVGEEHKVLERIFVEPDLHNRGIGTRAMELVFGLYPAAKLWTLGTPEWNVRTKSFYEKLGFVQVGWDLGDPGWRGRWYERSMDPSDPYVMKGVGELTDGMRNVDVEGTVVEKSLARAVRSRTRRKMLSVADAALEDETGRVVLTLWNEQIKQAKVGDRVRIENGYVRSYRGVTQLNVGRAGRLITLI
jgi:GNAT superfamily N-acetyltransferase